jgi:hypothetical protein
MNKGFLFYFGLILLLLASCNQVHVEIKNVPMNTPVGSQIYLTGNFNQWNPGDPNYLLKKIKTEMRIFLKWKTKTPKQHF